MSHFERAWTREPNLRLVGPGAARAAAQDLVGDSADRFVVWVSRQLGDLLAGNRQPTIVEINRFKVRLVDRLLAESLATPEPQRSIVHDSDGRSGLLGIFLITLETVAELTLAAEPPPLWEPPQPVVPKKKKKTAAPQPAGTWFAVENE